MPDTSVNVAAKVVRPVVGLAPGRVRGLAP